MKVPATPADGSSFADRVVQAVRQVEAGQIATYGEIAAEAGRPGAARAIGGILSRSDGLPWWRIVNQAGRLAPGLEEKQAGHLRNEGWDLTNNRVTMLTPEDPLNTEEA